MRSLSSLSVQRWLLPPVAAALALALQTGDAQAQIAPTPQGAAGPRTERLNLTPAQSQELFSGRKSMALRTTSARLTFLQQSERCLSGAKDLDGLRSCQQQERTAQRELMQRNRTEVAALYQRLGLPVPQPRGWKGQKRAGTGAEGAGKPTW
ncbi:hypothetical protein [Cyanobium sp. Morenito 9A2]|uniref:hypothetical protein n=1 Tax=Cyanobium sp. Morenito 9A2 TaxID=2823718 RepID=UPI0020CDB0BD|nr:hypothetical protein [Cyanobium sp. Morenito 9A2]MCP9850006.1 hypothetical protein [Cyanobium sp. Morenito 9A2]